MYNQFYEVNFCYIVPFLWLLLSDWLSPNSGLEVLEILIKIKPVAFIAKHSGAKYNVQDY